jgi:NADP-dependent 3-hydroxy acid dehydrogenase YdfG
VLGTKVRANAGAYCGTKFALEALSEGLRMELAGTDIRVSCIEPGLALTDMHRDFPVHPTAQQGMNSPLMPDDVARCVRFMLEQPGHVAIPRLLVLAAEQAV